MMRTSSIVRGVLALTLATGVVVGVACGGDDTTGAGPADASLGDAAGDGAPSDGGREESAPPFVDAGVGTFCQSTLGLYAPKLASCCDKDAAPQAYSNDESFIDLLAELCRESFGKSVASGRTSLDAAAASTCAAGLAQFVAAMPCPDINRSPSNQPVGSVFHDVPGCAQAIVGLQGEGAPCANDYECKDGLTCVGWTPNGDGTCKAPPALGQPCGNGIPEGGAFADIVRWGFGTHPRCVDGTYCQSSVFQQGTCRPTEGADAGCLSLDECATGLRCLLEHCQVGQPGEADASCKLSMDCQDRLYCKPSDDGGSHCAPRESAGASCTSNASSNCAGACGFPVGGGAMQCIAFCGSP